MFSYPLFKQMLKSNMRFLLAFTAVLCVFLTIMCNVFTPSTVQGLGGLTEGTIVGSMLSGTSGLTGFIANSFFALMAIIFPMVYSIMVGNRLIAEKIDRGTMAGLLSTPTTRLKISMTSAIYFIMSLVLMWGFVAAYGCFIAQVFQPDELDVETFLLLNAGCFLYQFAISGICFCSSCIFNLSKNSLTLGAGLPLYCFVVSLIVKLSEDLDVLKYFTLNTLFDTESIMKSSGYENGFLILLAIGIVLYAIGIFVFQKKDLPI